MHFPDDFCHTFQNKSTTHSGVKYRLQAESCTAMCFLKSATVSVIDTYLFPIQVRKLER
jgi:hypothetical protein